MSVTIRRPLYSGSGHRLYNGAGVGLSQEFTSDSLEQAIYDLLTEVRAVIGGPGSTITQMLGASAAQQQQIAVYARGAAALGLLGSMIAPEVGVPLTLGAEVIAIANELDLGGDVEPPAVMPVNTTTGIADGTYPVTPVTPPPTGYGGVAAEDVAEAVFAYPVNWLNATGEANLNFSVWLQEVMAALGPLAWASGVPDPRNPYFSLVAAYPTAIPYGALLPWSASAVPPVPALDFSAVLADDTVLSFLNREVDDYTWTDQGPWGEATPAGVFAALSGEYAGRYWRCNLTDEQLHLLALPISSEADRPPIWPGIDHVTLDDPYAISGDTEVELAMDGCLIALTTVPSKYSGWGLPGELSRYRVGYIAFRTDNGEWEPHQYLEFEQGLYCPKSMHQASSVVVHCSPGVEGTLTPYLRTT